MQPLLLIKRSKIGPETAATVININNSPRAIGKGSKVGAWPWGPGTSYM